MLGCGQAHTPSQAPLTGALHGGECELQGEVLATAYLYHGDPTLGSNDGGLGMMTIEGAFQSSDLLRQALEFVRGQHTTNDATCGVRMRRGPTLSAMKHPDVYMPSV